MNIFHCAVKFIYGALKLFKCGIIKNSRAVIKRDCAMKNSYRVILFFKCGMKIFWCAISNNGSVQQTMSVYFLHLLIDPDIN